MRLLLNLLTFLSLIIFALLVFSPRQQLPDLDISQLKVASQLRLSGVQKNSSLVLFKGKYVLSELQNNRLAIFDSFQDGSASYFDPKTIGKTFASPHYMATTPWGSLLVTNGWGRSVVEITDLKGNGWREFSGKGKKFNAPHGICVDEDGWIYVGDSLNSRLVRFRDMSGYGFEVFEDNAKLVAYSRELVCANGAIWVSNSYEPRPGLNKGKGGNVLRIDDFSSGNAEVVATVTDANLTAILPMESGVLMGLWGGYQHVVYFDFKSKKSHVIPGTSGEKNGFGVPYSFFRNPDGSVLTTYFGDFNENPGGLMVLSSSE